MTIRYFQTGGQAFGYDDTDQTAAPLIAAAVAAGWTEVTGNWPPPETVQQAQAVQLASLRAECDAAILAGYVSSALGAVYLYPSSTTDQINMMGSVTASMLPGLAAGWSTPFWCKDNSGVWAMRPHTASQIRQAGNDGKAWVLTCQQKLAALSATVAAATTVDAVKAVVWG